MSVVEAVQKDGRQTGMQMVSRFRRGWPIFVVATILAIVAWSSQVDGLMVAAGWLLIVLSVFAIRFGSAAVANAPTRDAVEEEADDQPLEEVVTAYRALDIPILILSSDATVLFHNPAAEKALGAFEVGSHLSARLRSPGILDMVRDTVATGEPNQMEHSERLPSERVYILRIAPILEEGAPVGSSRFYVLSFRDISELRRLDRMRSDFVANASHELRTPLASLRGFIETIQGPAKGDAKAQEKFLGIMLDQATRMSRLVDDLLSLSRLELKSHIAPDQRVDLVPVVAHVRDALVPLASDLGVDIRLHLPEGKVDVIGDRDELVQVVENLIENACKYGQEGEVVDVHLTKEDGQPVEFSVVDRGPGIPAEHVPRLTERFYRVSVADSRSKKGTGLGLAIVKHILTRHRARLIVKSEIGKGTTFTVRF